MVGIGPFIPHHDTCFAEKKSAGSVEETLFLLSVIRIFTADSIASGNDSSWNNGSARKRKGTLGRSKCCNAKFVAHKDKKTI